MIEVKKKDGESPLSVLRRFTKKMQQSGNLSVVRGLRFNKRSESKLIKKRRALKKIIRRKEYEHLKRIGKIE